MRDGGFDRFQCSLRHDPAALRFYGAPRDRSCGLGEARAPGDLGTGSLGSEGRWLGEIVPVAARESGVSVLGQWRRVV